MESFQEKANPQYDRFGRIGLIEISDERVWIYTLFSVI
jgi:hypothetical protein